MTLPDKLPVSYLCVLQFFRSLMPLFGVCDDGTTYLLQPVPSSVFQYLLLGTLSRPPLDHSILGIGQIGSPWRGLAAVIRVHSHVL